MKKRLLIGALALSYLSSINAAASDASSSSDPEASGQAVIAAECAAFIRVFRGPDFPEISMKSFKQRTPDGLIRFGDERLICILAAHVDPEMRRRTLDEAEQEIEKKDERLWRTGDDPYYQSEYRRNFLKKVRSSVLKSISSEGLIFRKQFFLAALFMECNRSSSSPSILVSGESLHNESDEPYYYFAHDHRDPATRYITRRFYHSGYIEELLCRIKAGECEAEVLTRAYKGYIEEHNNVGIEVDHEGLRAYFEERIRSADDSRL